jgi:phytanoyl-CoA hydroxylase
LLDRTSEFVVASSLKDHFVIMKAPDGAEMAVPVDVSGDSDYFAYGRYAASELCSYYNDNGYVIVRGAIEKSLCDEVSRHFSSEIKSYRGPLYRQTTGLAEANDFTPQGHVLNPVLNIQDLQSAAFPHFRSKGLDIITHKHVQDIVSSLLGEPGMIVQSMAFEGNPATWAHQDSYYLDSTSLGRMTAGWFAIEDIAPGAGRFFIYPKSHLMLMGKNSAEFDYAYHHQNYKDSILDIIRAHGLKCRAPALGKGDILFWNSMTVHGSLDTTTPAASRRSLTAHYVPASAGLLQFQKRERQLQLATINGIAVHCPKSQERFLNRLVLSIAYRFPGPFKAIKRLAIKLLTG